MTPGFGTGTFAFSDQKPPQRRIKEWSPIDRMLAEKGSKRRSKTELPPLSVPPPPLPVITTDIQVQTESWEVLLREAVSAALVPEQEKHKALQAEISAMQQQLKEKDDEIESYKRSATEAKAAHAAELAQFMEEKRSIQDFKKSVEKQRLQWTQERDALEATQNLLRAELQSARAELQSAKTELHSAKTEASDERWQKEEMDKDLSSQLEAARKARADSCEEVGSLHDQLQQSQDDMKYLSEQMAALKEEHAELTQERDDLLQRLEDEQAEMIARVAAMEAQLAKKGREDDIKKSAEKQRLQWAQEKETFEASQNLLRAELQSARTEASDERWQKEEMEKELSSQLETARKARAECRAEVDSLQDELRRSQDDMKSLKKQMAALKEEHAAVAQERDDLLQRLEDEQAEMIARVAAMEAQLSKRGR